MAILAQAQPLIIKAAANYDPNSKKLDLVSGWNDFWGTISGSLGPITALMNIVGVLLVVFAIVKWAWNRRKGMNGGFQGGEIWGALLIGAVLCAPSLIIPGALSILDVVGNALGSIWMKNTGA